MFTVNLEILFKTFIIMLNLSILTIFISLGTTFFISTNELKSDFSALSNSHMLQISEMFRRYFFSNYLSYIEELALISTTFEKIHSQYDSENSDYVNVTRECLSHENLDFVYNGTQIPWYINKRDTFYGSWYYQDYKHYSDLKPEIQKNLKILCQMKPMFTDLLKQKSEFNDFPFGVSVLAYSITFPDSLTYQFPYYRNRFHLNSTLCRKTSERGNLYIDPTCFRSYEYFVKSNKSIQVASYQASSYSHLANDSSVCMKLRDNLTVFCLEFKYENFKFLKYKLNDFIENSQLIIIQTFQDQNNYVVFSNSDITRNSNDFIKLLHLNLTYIRDDVFNIFYLETLKRAYDSIKISNINENKVKAITQNLSLLQMYNQATNSFNKDEYLLIKLAQTYLNMTSFLNDVLGENNLFDKNTTQELILKYQYVNSGPDNEIIKVPAEKIYQFIPLNLGFDFDYKYNTINFTNHNNFWLMAYQKETENDIRNNIFIYYILTYLIDAFIFCFGVNIMIWTFIGSIFYFVLKTILAPLNILKEEFEALIIKSVEESGSKKLKKNSIHGNDFQNQDLMFDYGNLIKKFQVNSSDFLANNGNKIFDYEEVREAFIVLEILNFIQNYKLQSFKKFKGESSSKIKDIIEIFFFLMYRISDEIIDNKHFDEILVSNLIYHNFYFRITSTSDDKDIEFFFDYFISLIEKIIKSAEKSYENEKSTKIFDDLNEMDLEKAHLDSIDTRKIFETLREEIIYKYCVYKFNLIDEIKNKKNSFIFEVGYSSKNNLKGRNYETENDSDGNFISESIKKKAKILFRNGRNSSLDISRKFSSFAIDYKKDCIVKDKNRIVKEIIESLLKLQESNFSTDHIKIISIKLMLAHLLIETNNTEDSIKQSLQAMEIIQNFVNKIQENAVITKFFALFISSIFYDRILMMFSNISDIFDQNKTHAFINLKLLDLSPVCNSTTNLTIYQKILDTSQKAIDELKIKNFNFKTKEKYFKLKLLKNKIRALQNMNRFIPKNVVFLYDIKFLVMDYLDLIYILKNNKQQENLNIQSVLFSDQTYFCPPDFEGDQLYYLFELKKNLIANNSYLDSALVNCIDQFGFEEYPKNNNFINIFTTIDVVIDFDSEKMEQLLKKTLKGNYTVTLFMLLDPRIKQSQQIKNKLVQVQKWVEAVNYNGKLVIIENFETLKKLVNFNNPIKFNEFDCFSLKDIIKSIDLDVILNPEANFSDG